MKRRIRKTKLNKKNRRLFQIDGILLMTVVAVFLFCELVFGLILKGDNRITLNAGEDFRDPGVRSHIAQAESDVDTDIPGNYTVEYTLFGRTAVRDVHVADPSDLVLGLKGSSVQRVRQGDPYIESGAFAVDKRRGALDQDSIRISGKPDTNKPGEYKIKYKVQSLDISKEIERTVAVVPRDEFIECEDVPVLMYHWIYSQDDLPDRVDGNWIEDTALEEQLSYLKQNDYYYPSWSELNAWVNGRISLPEKSVILTFDDGKKAFYVHGKPLFEKYQIPVTSFMICWENNKAESKIREYASAYIEFESHTYGMHQAGHVRGHRGLIAAITKDEIREDLRRAARITGNNDALAYPYGDYTTEGQEAVSELGIKCAMTTEYDRVRQGMDTTRLPRVRVSGTQSFYWWQKSIAPSP